MLAKSVEYKQFRKTVKDDYAGLIVLTAAEASQAIAIPSKALGDALGRFQQSLAGLPGSTDAEALRLEAEAREALDKRQAQQAITALYRALAADPKFV
jgi:hypothetical protein